MTRETDSAKTFGLRFINGCHPADETLAYATCFDQPSVSLFGVLFYFFVNDMPFVLARFHLFWRERYHFFVWQHRVATHVILKAGRLKHEDHAGGVGSRVLHVYPGERGYENSSSCVYVAFLVSHMSVNGPFHDIQNLILPEVLVHGEFVSGMHVLSAHDKMLRTVVSWADLQDEIAGRRLTPNPALTLIFFEEERFCNGLERGCGTGLCRSRLKSENG